ncbi:MAG: hypothetical protein MUF79_04935 [Burkholderiales bacterium]|jgi:hypothetical protein|nr:hypothetical protein [Burkholderiales bacterium]
MPRDVSPPWRIPLLILAFASLAAGTTAGLARLGWGFAAPAAAHGPLMITAFFGTVISLERAVAIGARWAYLGPLASGLGGIALATGVGSAYALPLAAVGSLVLFAATLSLFARQKTLFMFTLLLATLAWFVASLLRVDGREVWQVTPWWIGFLVLTIAGERLELSRFLPPSRLAQGLFAAILAWLGVSLVATALAPGRASMSFGAAMVVLALWLLRHDIARRTVRERGLTRFIAVALLAGYFWLALGGAAIVAGGGLVPGGPSYDAALHMILVGFVFSMVFGHAPIIFPAVLRVQVPYSPLFYLPLAVLHASLVVRVVGDYSGDFGMRSAGGMGNALALALFVLVTVSAVVRGLRTRRDRPLAG